MGKRIGGLPIVIGAKTILTLLIIFLVTNANGYYWDGAKRCWWKNLLFEEIEIEKNWLANNVYGGDFIQPLLIFFFIYFLHVDL